MRNFDDVREKVRPEDDRRFIIRGRTLTVRERVMPEAQATIEDVMLLSSAAEVLVQYDRGMELYLEPESAAIWKELRANGDDPIEMREIYRLTEFLLEATADRPTDAPSASTDGRATTKDSSEAPSSPQEEKPTT